MPACRQEEEEAEEKYRDALGNAAQLRGSVERSRPARLVAPGAPAHSKSHRVCSAAHRSDPNVLGTKKHFIFYHILNISNYQTVSPNQYFLSCGDLK